MKSIAIVTGYMLAVTLIIGLCAQAANAAEATSSSQSQAAATGINHGVNQGITFQNHAPDSQTLYRAPSIAVPQSAFGFSGQNCGGADTGGISTPWGAIGGSNSHGMKGCNTRADVTILWKMGLHRVAKMRMLCYGLDNTRKAFESSGGICPAGATAESLYTKQSTGLHVNVDAYGAGAAYAAN